MIQVIKRFVFGSAWGHVDDLQGETVSSSKCLTDSTSQLQAQSFTLSYRRIPQMKAISKACWCCPCCYQQVSWSVQLFDLLYRYCLLEGLFVIIIQSVAAGNDFIYLTLWYTVFGCFHKHFMQLVYMVITISLKLVSRRNTSIQRHQQQP